MDSHDRSVGIIPSFHPIVQEPVGESPIAIMDELATPPGPNQKTSSYLSKIYHYSHPAYRFRELLLGTFSQRSLSTHQKTGWAASMPCQISTII
jgi:hypothetical protein